MYTAGGHGPPSVVTRLLREARDGDPDAANRVIELAYTEMKRLADDLAGPRRHAAINATSLVHEVWIKLDGRLDEVNDRRHFLALAARAMRQVIADRARAQSREKRGGRRVRLTLQDHDAAVSSATFDLSDFHSLVERLRLEYPRQADVFELRAYGTLMFAEIASLQEMSESSARLDWQFARAWLRSRLEGERPA